MTESLSVNGKELQSVKMAAKQFSYSRDYVTRLAREQKIKASRIGRQWFVDVESLRHYVDFASVEQVSRHRQLSEQRQREQLVRLELEQRRAKRVSHASQIQPRATVLALLILGFGLAGGSVSYQIINSLPAKVSVATLPVTELLLAGGDQGMVSNQLPAPATKSVEPSQQIESLANATATGVLLLREPGREDDWDATAVAELFSDPVAVQLVSDDRALIVPLDTVGATTGPAVPYIVVPIKENRL